MSSAAASDSNNQDAESSWVVLVVDDEPEVHEVTELVLGETTFCGITLELKSAFTAEQAKAVLNERRDTALVLLDVVMESDDAGLSLTRYIREELGDEDVQIILRTGQPGYAPENDVILNYDINGYFLKVEVTAQKLHSVVISSLRNYQYIKNLKRSIRDRRVGRPNMPSARMTGLARTLRKALRDRALAVRAQPQIQLSSGAIAGIQVTPHVTVPNLLDGEITQLTGDIDDPGLSLEMDKWLLQQSCTIATRWHEIGQASIKLVVPILSLGFGATQVMDAVERCLSMTGLQPARLVLELREAAIMVEHAVMRGVVDKLRAVGVQVALVHSATCMISLRRLKQVQPVTLKVPQALVKGLSSSSESAALVRAIIALAHTLGMTTVAEGVSTQAELEFLKWEGCDFAQGDLIAQSLSVNQTFGLLNEPRIAKPH